MSILQALTRYNHPDPTHTHTYYTHIHTHPLSSTSGRVIGPLFPPSNLPSSCSQFPDKSRQLMALGKGLKRRIKVHCQRIDKRIAHDDTEQETPGLFFGPCSPSLRLLSCRPSPFLRASHCVEKETSLCADGR